MASNHGVRRIAFLSLHSSPLAPIGSADAGGMNVYVRRMADEFSRQDIRVDVFTRRTDPRAPDIIRTKDGARIIHLKAGPARPLPKSVLPLHIPSMADAMRLFARRENIQYDVLHSHYWISGLTALRCRTIVDGPIVHMFHTLCKLKELYTGEPDSMDSALRYDGERAVISGADAVIGATQQERDDMERLYGVPPASFAVIPPGVDLDKFQARDREECRRLLNIDADRVILFVGRPDRIKGLDVLLYALADLQQQLQGNVQLLIVGDPTIDQNKQKLPSHRLIRRLGLSDKVQFRGIVSQEDLSLYYAAADVCAMPSAYESFGMVAIESMACQTPVVAFAVGGLAATIKDGQTGFLAEPGDRAGYTSTLRRALESAPLADIGRRARMSVRPYEWSNIVDRTLELYDQVSCRPVACSGAAGGC